MMKFLFLIGVLLIVVAYSTSINSTQIQPRKKILFKPDVEQTSWSQSLKICHMHGAKLVTLSTPEEEAEFTQYLIVMGYENDAFWTSGQDIDRDGKFSWISTGQEFDYANWGEGDPSLNNTENRCVHTSRFKWWDTSCNGLCATICEINLL